MSPKRNTTKKRVGNETRSYCVHCGVKRYKSELFNLTIPLLLRSVWICGTCYLENTFSTIKTNTLSTPEDKNQAFENRQIIFIIK